MNALRFYILRLTACAFLVSLISAIVTHPRMKRVVHLIGACLIAVCALQPLLAADLSQLYATVPALHEEQQARLARAQAQNEALLEDLIRAQTESAIQSELERRGMTADFNLSLQFDEALGLPVPWAITVSSTCSDAQQQDFSQLLAEQFGIPKERQKWRSN